MFTLDDLQVARGLTGVYFLYNKDKQLVYIGKSVDVYVRILEHRFEQKKDFHFFKVAGVKKLAFAELLEIYLIEKYKTHGEKVGVYPISENNWLDMGQIDEMEEMRRRLEKDE